MCCRLAGDSGLLRRGSKDPGFRTWDVVDRRGMGRSAGNESKALPDSAAGPFPFLASLAGESVFGDLRSWLLRRPKLENTCSMK